MKDFILSDFRHVLNIISSSMQQKFLKVHQLLDSVKNYEKKDQFFSVDHTVKTSSIQKHYWLFNKFAKINCSWINDVILQCKTKIIG